MIPAAVCLRPITPRTLRHTASTLVLAALVLTTAPARADNLDAALLKHAPEVMGYLQQHHCRNVGVLKFRVHKAGHPVSFKAGTITDNMVERLENALIAVNPTGSPVGVIHDADHIAVARKLPRYDNPAGQRALFAQKYPLAWGNTQVTPDLMLTGIVSVRADLKSATVQIEAFGPDSPKQDKVVAFTVATDRSLLTDLNESFKISSRNLKRKTRAIELDEEAVGEAADDNSKPPGQTTPDPSTAATVTANMKLPDSLLSYEIRYDGQPQAVTSDPSNPQEFVVPEPKQNQAVSFIVKSLAPERIGLVLMVNGKSTLYEEDGDPSHCKAWVLDPGKTYGIDGFQVDNSTRKPFRVLSDEESAASTYGPNTGLIQFHIFRSGTKDNTAVDDGHTDSPAMNISLRGLQREKAGKSRSLADLKKVVQAHAHATNRRKRGLIMGSDNTVAGSIENDEVQNQVLVQSIAVRYYKPKGQ